MKWLPLLTFALAAGAPGAEPFQIKRVELYPTWSAIGIEGQWTGSFREPVQFSWRNQGTTQWQPGVDLTLDHERKLFHASIWPLAQGGTIEVKVEAPRSTIKPWLGRCTTKSLRKSEPRRSFFVSPNGSNSNPGTAQKPWQSLSFAAGQVKPGDAIYCLSGTYKEGNLFKGLKGAPDRPIVIAAAPGQKPLLDSSLLIKEGSQWQQNGILHSIPVAMIPKPGYVSQNGRRMFRYSSLAELKADAQKVKRSWFYDAGKKRLHVRTGDRKPPSDHAYRISQHDYGLLLSGSSHVIINGLAIRGYGNCAIRISEGSHNCEILDNTISNCPSGIFLKGQTTKDNAIWRNEIYEQGLTDFSWNAIKASEYPRQGIFCIAGRGNSFCYNRVHGWFDCICPESWKRPKEPIWNRDCDVMFNDLYNAGDDAIEADGGGVNLRIHGNHIRNCLTALSLAPIERGPVYCCRNDATFLGLMFKLNVNGSTSPGWTFCYHNSGYCLAKGPDGGTGISFPTKIPCSNKVFLNNVMICNEWSVRGAKPGYHLNYNCYYHVPGKPPRKFQWQRKSYRAIGQFAKATGQEKQGLYRDPQFRATPGLGSRDYQRLQSNGIGVFPLVKSAAMGDLQLKATSPCIDSGVRIRGFSDFHGSAPDRGAFEHAPK